MKRHRLKNGLWVKFTDDENGFGERVTALGMQLFCTSLMKCQIAVFYQSADLPRFRPDQLRLLFRNSKLMRGKASLLVSGFVWQPCRLRGLEIRLSQGGRMKSCWSMVTEDWWAPILERRDLVGWLLGQVQKRRR